MTDRASPLYNPLTNNWGELILVSGHPAAKMNEEVGRFLGPRERQLSAELRRDLGSRTIFHRSRQRNHRARRHRQRSFREALLQSGEDPLGQHFGLDLPENAGTFRIVGIVRDAKFAGFALRKPARPMFYVPNAQIRQIRQRIDGPPGTAFAFVGGLLLVTTIPPARSNRS